MAKDIRHLAGKVSNKGITPDGRVSHEEWNESIEATIENQEEIARIKEDAKKLVRGVQFEGVMYRPDTDGIVSFNAPSGDVRHVARLFFARDTDLPLVSVGGTMAVELRYSAVRSSDGERVNANYQGTLHIRRQVAGGTRQEVGTLSLTSRGENSSQWDSVDLAPYLVDGQQTINLAVSYQPLDENGKAQGNRITSADYNLQITRTTLSVAFAGDATQPLDTNGGQITLPFQLSGEVARTLHIKISGSKGTRTYTKQLGAGEYTNILSTYNAVLNVDNDTAGLLTHGVKTIEAWLTCSDGTTPDSIESAHMMAQLMVVADETDTTPRVLVQGLVQKAVNYVQTTLCSFVVYAPAGTTHDVVLRLTDYAASTEYFRLEQRAEAGVLYAVPATIEIEDGTNDTLFAYFVVEDGSGNALTQRQGIEVDNSQKFAPTLGADFLLNPKTRNNAEANPRTIVNAMSGELVAATFSGFGAETDLWVQDDNGQRVLRVLAGQQVAISYDWLKSFATNNAANVTMELDYCVRNITDEAEPIVNASEAYGDSFIGLQLSPLEGIIYTKSKKARQEQNFLLAEDARTHISINIVSALRATTDTAATPLSLCRVFINGVINREFLFDATSKDWHNNGSTIVIGHAHADIDVYSLRVYTKALSAGEVLNNYTATLPTAEEKVAFRTSNAILSAATNLIDLNKCKEAGKNALVWHGTQPNINNTAKQKGWWEIHVYKADGTEDLDHSGTICKETKSLVASRQGTTANTYFYSNLQTKLKDVKATIRVAVEDLHADIVVGEPELNAEDGKQYVKMYGCGLGKNDWANKAANREKGAQSYEYDNGVVVVPDGWVDGNGKYRGKAYKLSTKTDYGQKLVNKINYASAMQSHLMGANNAYNDLHEIVVGRVGMQRDNAKARLCKQQLPFLYFNQEADSTVAVYQGPGTFGPGKMDDAAMGYDKKQYPNFCMMEGKDNNLTLTDFRVPFDSSKISLVLDGDDTKGWEVSGLQYNGAMNLELDRYAATSKEVNGKMAECPNDYVLGKIRQFVNFIYNHSPRIKVFVGAWSGAKGFVNSESAKQTTYKWWCTEGADAYKLRRWDEVEQQWVEAGWDEATEQPTILRLNDVYAQQVSANAGDWEAMNTAIVRAIAEKAKGSIDEIINSKSLRFHYMFVNSFLAGTDNCSKNTYYILIPDTDGEYRWAFAQDDMDTILATDNSGYQNKPYYIDRQHPTSDLNPTEGLYQGAANALFDLEEAMFEETGENVETMRAILTAMSNTSGSAWAFLEEYFFGVQQWMPAVAYNEAARIRYEYPASLGFVSSRQIQPITQSCGDQLLAEQEFMKKRLVLYASYAHWARFNAYNSDDAKNNDIGLSDTAAVLGIQANDSNAHFVELKGIVPHQYMYVTGFVGGASQPMGVRCKPGVAYDFDITRGRGVSGDTPVGLCGANYFRSFGNLGDLYQNNATTFTITGKRLQDVVIEPSGNAVFNPPQLVVQAPQIEQLSIKGSTNIGGTLNLSQCIRLKSVNTEGSAVSEVQLPKGRMLAEVKLGTNTINLTAQHLPALTTLTAQGFNKLQSLTMSDVPKLGTQVVATQVYRAQPASLRSVTIEGVAWKDASADMVTWLADMGAKMSGTIAMTAATRDRYITFAEKVAMGRVWGNIDDKKNALYVSYTTRAITAAQVRGDVYLDKVGSYTFEAVITPATGNDVRIAADGTPDVAWSVDALSAGMAAFADSSNGVLSVTSLDTAENDHAVSVAITKTNGQKVEAEARVVYHKHKPRVGDLLYGDGLIDEAYHANRDLVGLVYMVEDVEGVWRTHAVSSAGVIANKDNAPVGLSGVDDTNGFKSSASAMAAAGITSPFDIEGLKNYTAYPAGAITTTATEDGWPVVTDSNNMITDFAGRENTRKIVEHAERLIVGYLGRPMPTTLDELDTALADIRATYGDKYQQFYYPPFLQTWLFEPAHTQPLAGNIKKGNWHTASGGEAARIVSYERQGTSVAKASDAEQKEAFTPIIANMAKKAGVAWADCDIIPSSELYRGGYTLFPEIKLNWSYLNANSKKHFGALPCITLDIAK